MKAYSIGISRSVEVMVPAPSFLEAVKMLKNDINVEVGIHLVLNAEWSKYKWRPLTNCPSLTDSNGYFLPAVWSQTGDPNNIALRDAKWKITEVENELRAQIEMAQKHIPQLNHITTHMHFPSCSKEIGALVNKLAKEYNLINTEELNITPVGLWDSRTDTSTQLRVTAAIKNISSLKPGTYIFIDHPSVCSGEMEVLSDSHYYNASVDRDLVTRTLTSSQLIEFVKSKNVNLIMYKDVVK
jgi:predicted glycoside hydrolase/deacetylase ChbG (UPF0249 family)